MPAVVLSGLLELGSIVSGEEGQHVGFGNLALATLLAFVSGYAAIAWLLRFLTEPLDRRSSSSTGWRWECSCWCSWAPGRSNSPAIA